MPSLRSSRPLKKPLVAMSVGAPSDNVTAPHPSAAGVEVDSGLMVVLRSDLARSEALRIGRIRFGSAGAMRKPKEAIAA